MPISIPEPIYPSRMTIRQQIVRELRRRLARITVANGYATNLGTNLWYGPQTTPLPITPIIYYRDHFEQADPKMGALFKSFQIQIETYDHIVVPEGDALQIDDPILAAQQMPIISNQHLADLMVALQQDSVSGQNDQRFGGLAHGIQYLESDPFAGIQPGELLWCGLNSQWTIQYQHVLGDPYSLKRT